MLQDLHLSLQRLLYERGNVDLTDIDVRFEAPTKEWIGSLTLPTINFFLFQVLENTDLRNTSYTTTRGNNSATRRMPPRRFDLYYMVSVLSTSIVDEHEILWSVLYTLLKHGEIPNEVLSGPLQNADPALTSRVGQNDEDPNLLDIWSGLETHPRPTLLYVVTVPLDIDISRTSPLVLTRQARYSRFLKNPELTTTRIHIGGTIRNKAGEPLAGVRIRPENSAREDIWTDREGKYVLSGVPAGEIKLLVARGETGARKVTLTIPSTSYDIILE